MLAVVEDGKYRLLHVDTGPRNGVDVVDTNGETLMLTESSDVAEGEPAALWYTLFPTTGGRIPSEWSHDELADEQDRRASWLRPLLDGEENYRAIGAIRHDGIWSIHGWMAWDDGWTLLDGDEQLYARSAPQTLLTGTTETTVVVAGPVSDKASGKPGPPQVWSLFDGVIDDPSSPGRWVHEPMASVPDALTDVAYWDLGWWVAGHRGLRPVVYDYDSLTGTRGRQLPVPDTRLDPEHPTVIVAGIPGTTVMVLATQSENGNAVWVNEDRDTWTRIPGPPGDLTDALHTEDGDMYLLVNGTLWYRQVTVPKLTSPTTNPAATTRSNGRPR